MTGTICGLWVELLPSCAQVAIVDGTQAPINIDNIRLHPR